MTFCLDVSGITVKIRIKGYETPDKAKWDYQWCDVDFSFEASPWLNYCKENDEVFLSSEVNYLAHELDDLLSDNISEITWVENIEPDFSFGLHPRRDLRNDPKYTYIREGCEIADIYMEWKIAFWNRGLTDNYLSLTFDRDEIAYLRNYLFYVIGELKVSDFAISDMIQKGILILD